MKENTADPNEQSEEIMQKCIYSKNLAVGDRIYFTWFPDRECLVEYQENNVFALLEQMLTFNVTELIKEAINAIGIRLECCSYL